MTNADKAAQLTVAATWGNKPLEALNALISRRINELGQSAEHSVVGTAIAALRSLRAQTAVAKTSKIHMGAFSVECQKKLYGAWLREKGARKSTRCFRMGRSHTDPSVRLVNGRFPYRGQLLTVYWYVEKDTPQDQCRVFLVTKKNDQRTLGGKVENFVVVAKSKAKCTAAIKERQKKRINRYRFLARNALTVAMTNIAKNAPAMQGSGRARRVASVLSSAQSYKQGRGWAVEIHDNLRYAALAVKGGEAGINLAIAKAANKIAGNIIHQYHREGKYLDPSVAVPFPEVLARGAM